MNIASRDVIISARTCLDSNAPSCSCCAFRPYENCFDLLAAHLAFLSECPVLDGHFINPPQEYIENFL